MVTLTATVTDAETPVGQLQFAWTVAAGTFTGQGAKVVWQPPRTTPRRPTTRPTLDRDGNATDRRPTWRQPADIASAVKARSCGCTTPPKEVGDMSRAVPVGLRQFEDPAGEYACVTSARHSCPAARRHERRDITENRIALRHPRFELGWSRVTRQIRQHLHADMSGCLRVLVARHQVRLWRS